MTRNEGQGGLDRPISVSGMDIGVAQARGLILTTTFPGSGSGLGMSSRLRGEVKLCTTAAFIVFSPALGIKIHYCTGHQSTLRSKTLYRDALQSSADSLDLGIAC